MQIVADAEVDPKEWQEETFVGRVLADNGIFVVHEPRFVPCHCDVCLKKWPQSMRITSHTLNPQEMYELYKHLRTDV